MPEAESGSSSGFSGGGGGYASSSTEESPHQQAEQLLAEVRSGMNSILGDANLQGVLDQATNLNNQIGSVRASLQQLRGQRYIYRGHLEGMLEACNTNAASAIDNTRREARRLADIMAPRVSTLQRQVEDAARRVDRQGGQALSMLEGLKRDLDDMESDISNSASSLQQPLNQLSEQLSAIQGEVASAEWVVQNIAEATFKLEADEHAVAGCEATYFQDDKKIKGNLFLTDRRLAFEQEENVPVGMQFLGIGKKQAVHKLILDVPVELIDKAAASESGVLMFHKEVLDVQMKGGAPVQRAHFELKQDSAWWPSFVNKVVSGDINHERCAAAGGPVTEDAGAALPLKCPSCGAQVDNTNPEVRRKKLCLYCETRLC